MPNWVTNDLIITGNNADLQKFKKLAKEGKDVLSANKFIPYPKEYLAMDIIAEEKNKLSDKKGNDYSNHIKDGYNSGGYDWCIQHWGTKWGFVDPQLKKQKNDELYYYFETAWSPPDPLIEKMSKMFPKLVFELKYGGEIDEEGGYKLKNGKEIKKMRA